MKFRVFISILGESLRFAGQNLRANVLRTMLSLLGVTIGVFCIISIFTLIDSLENNIRDSISRLGDNVIFVSKWPWIFAKDYPWWKYLNRPEVGYKDMVILQKNFKNAKAVAFSAGFYNQKVTVGDNSADGISVVGVTQDYANIVSLTYDAGRFFSENESNQGDKVIVLGYDIATSLFNSPQQALDKTVIVLNRKLRVIGVLSKQGKAMGIGSGQDKQAITPFNFTRSITDVNNTQLNNTILVKAMPGETLDRLEDDLAGAMRNARRLGPWDDDNFALNRITMITDFISKLFGQINFFGWIIAGFSILIGGVGIANIMFVSVKERTPIIGIQKSLGARSYFILAQFLCESVFLCILGGMVGLVLILMLCPLINALTQLTLVLTFKNALIGIGISSVIGIVSGYIPALQAARMDPIEAIRSGF